MDTDLVSDFITRYEQGDPTKGYTGDEARTAFERATQVASPETLRRAAGRAVDRLDDGQREAFDELLRRQSPSTTKTADGPGSFGLDELLSGLFGLAGPGSMGGQTQWPGQSRGPVRQSPNITSGLGQLLASPVGRAVIGGIGAFALKEIMHGHR